MTSMSLSPNKNMTDDFNTIKSMLESGENFSFSRFSDGELLVCNGIEVAMQSSHNQIGGATFNADNSKDDVKHFDPKIHQETQRRVVKALLYNDDNYFKGLNCFCCTAQMWGPHLVMKERSLAGNPKNLTWANLLINSNYTRFINEIVPILEHKEVYFIVNEAAELDEHQINFAGSFRVGENCMVNDLGIIDEIKERISSSHISGSVYLFAASSLSNIAIHELHMFDKSNTYIDIGSALNPITKGVDGSREYMKQLEEDSLQMRECKW